MSIQTKSNTEDTGNNINYTVATVQKKVLERSSVTMFFNNKQHFENIKSVDDNYNRVAGMDFEFLSSNSAINAKSFFHYSFNPENFSNAAAFGSKFRYRSQKLNLFAGFDAVGDNYITNMGYVPRLQHEYNDTTYRIGYVQIRTNGHYRFYLNENDLVDFIGPEYQANIFTDYNLNYNEHDLDLSFIIRFMSTSELKFTFSDYSPLLYFPFQLSGLQAYFEPGNYANNRFNIAYDTGKRNRLFGRIELGYGGEYIGNKFSLSGELNWRTQPWGVFGFSVSQENLMKYPEKYGEVAFTLIGSKVELSFSKNLFFTTFLQYNTQGENFNINSRFNWRFKPMSDLYLVYTENYTSNHLKIKDRALVLKMTYWFNL